MSKPHFLVVQGSWHTTHHVRFLIDELQTANFPVTAINLPTTSPDISELATLHLTDDVHAIRAAIEHIAHTNPTARIIPVLHSYACVPGTDALALLAPSTKPLIHRVIYLAGVIRYAGECHLSQFNNTLAPWITGDQTTPTTHVTSANALEIFYHDCDPALAKDAAKHLLPHTSAAMFEPLQSTGWRGFNCTFVFCEGDRALPPFLARQSLDEMTPADRAGWDTLTVPGGHSPFLAGPKACAEMLVRIAEGGEGRMSAAWRLEKGWMSLGECFFEWFRFFCFSQRVAKSKNADTDNEHANLI